MNLQYLFRRCLGIPYSEVGISSNYATERFGDTLYIFFEHSNGKSDWKINLDFPAKPYKRMGSAVWFAHRGFLRQWKETEGELSGIILDKSLGKIIITGYSHGAALAVLCHEYVWFNRPDMRESLLGFGFGCPRVIWGIKTKQLSRRFEGFTVIRNIDDIVTHLPPAILGYVHVGKMLEIGEKGKYSPVGAHFPENILHELSLTEKDKAEIPSKGFALSLN